LFAIKQELNGTHERLIRKTELNSVRKSIDDHYKAKGPESVKTSDNEIKAKRNSALSSAIIEETAKQLE
jgi:hypothetical protein